MSGIDPRLIFAGPIRIRFTVDLNQFLDLRAPQVTRLTLSALLEMSVRWIDCASDHAVTCLSNLLEPPSLPRPHFILSGPFPAIDDLLFKFRAMIAESSLVDSCFLRQLIKTRSFFKRPFESIA